MALKMTETSCWRAALLGDLSLVRQAPYVSRQNLDLLFSQLALLRGHLVAPPIVDDGDDIRKGSEEN